ncbi:unnamed protein product [Trichobilharzia szidati]|nr:unnamed protein product [Trichobilharzia szidati]
MSPKSTAFIHVVKRLSSYWSNVKLGPPDAILGITEAYNRDTNPKKINLGAGAYRDDNGKPFVLPSVKEAERILLGKDLNKEYAPISGIAQFCDLSIKLALTEQSPRIKEKCTATVQTISGTGALRIGGSFVNAFAEQKHIWMPTPTWGNHKPIFIEGEIRDHGVGFYAFSADAEKREAEMNRLRELHRATEEGRARAEAIRAKRDAKMGQRLARLRARKGLPDVATAAAQCLGEAVVPAAATPTPLGPDAQSDIRLSNDDLDVASMLRRLRDEAEQRTLMNNSRLNESLGNNVPPAVEVKEPQCRTNLADVLASQDPSRTHTPGSKQREWDRGKSMISAQRYIQEEREKRVSDFAPPSHY